MLRNYLILDLLVALFFFFFSFGFTRMLEMTVQFFRRRLFASDTKQSKISIKEKKELNRDRSRIPIGQMKQLNFDEQQSQSSQLSIRSIKIAIVREALL